MFIPGTSMNDTLLGTIFDDEIFGYGGDDYLEGGTGADYLDGGMGTDAARYSHATSGVVVRLDTGKGYAGEAAGDVLVNIENLIGSAYDDTLAGDGGRNYVWAGGGNDFVFGLGDQDILYGNDGDDQLWGGEGNDYLIGGAGFDYARYDYATSGVEVYLDRPVFGGTGGGFAGEAFNDALIEIEGLVGSDFNDILGGNAGANVLIGKAGNDLLFGRDGDDQLFGNEGYDYIDGGLGFDYARYDTAATGVYVRLDTHSGYTGEAAGDYLLDIEGLSGSAHDDELYGDGFANALFGWNGDDRLVGLAGDDALLGGDGTDDLTGGAGGDYLDGGSGFDFARYDGAVSAVNVRLDTGAGYTGEAFGDTLVGIEGLIGSSFDDTLVGDGGSNQLRGAAGSDQLRGGAGKDFFMFDAGDLVAASRDQILDFGTGSDADYLVFSGVAPGSALLTNVGGGTIVSMADPTYWGDIFVAGIDAATLAGHLMYV